MRATSAAAATGAAATGALEMYKFFYSPRRFFFHQVEIELGMRIELAKGSVAI